MILIITSEADHHADFFEKKLRGMDIPYFRYNADKFGVEHSVSYEIETGHALYALKEPARKIDLSEITGIWYRKPFITRFDRIHQDPSVAFSAREADSYLNDFYTLLEGKKWINHPISNRRGDNKLWQLRLAREMGMTIPKTCVTNDPDLLQHFFSTIFPGEVIYKTLSNPNISEGKDTYRSVYTTVIPELTKQILESVKETPCLFQEKIEKDSELRLTTVGSKVFGIRLYSQEHEETSIDWRKDPDKVTVRQEPFEPDEDLRKKCVDLTHQLWLNFSTIDMIQGHDGRLIFLEVNPNGNWLWKELTHGLNISQALIEELHSA